MSLRIITFLFISFLSASSYAGKTVVLIHGYLGDASSWYNHGIVSALQGYDTYTVNLPSEAPLVVQAQYLDVYLRDIKAKHPKNSLVLVGHSAGGVVARLVMVRSGIPIQGLITISSPNLGTDKAELAYNISNSPLAWVAPFFGLTTINRSRDLYRDLMREHPSSLIFWLNRQPHPKAYYASIVRIAGDKWVAPYSQDLNDVPALRGLATTITSVGTHSLQPTDGAVLVDLLRKM
jgi:alpha-beta hydrolase superfamily lysophospholipase